MLISDLSSEQLLMLIVPALPNMWALKHAMYHDFPTPREKYRWMMACVFIPCLGGIAYYFVGRKHASREKVDIRARLEAERARAAGEKTGDAESSEGLSSEGALPEAGGVVEMVDVADDAVRESERTAHVPDSEAVALRRTPESSEPAAGAEAVSRGDDWSFGCPDDARRS